MTIRRITVAFGAVAIPLLLAACGTGAAASLPVIPSLAPETPTPAPTHPGPTYPEGCPKAQPAPLAAGETRTITVTTSKGDMVLTIEADLSPIAAGNFVALAECGYYNDVIFHRLVPGFVIQAGDGMFGREPNVAADLVGSGGPSYTIKDEPVTVPYTRGTLAMAKTSAVDSANSQFFIVLADLGDGLDPRYQVFGHVTGGLDVVDAIAAMPNSGSPNNAALEPVAMTKVTVSKP